jgi:predicted dithiol-disulfide oxidoreductase (DUF899 family)
VSVDQQLLHSLRMPGESDEYRQSRDDLLRAERDLRRQIEGVAAQRRALPPGGEVPADYVFDEWDAAANAPRQVRLSELFEDGKDTLFLYSFMMAPGARACPSCTSIVDGIDGAQRHIAQRINFAVCAKAPIAEFHAHAHARGWRDVHLLSSFGSTYNRDYHTESPDGRQHPIATVFTRRGGAIRHFWSSELAYSECDEGQHPRHVDFMWPVWTVLDRTPEGRGTDWGPELEYETATQRESRD